MRFYDFEFFHHKKDDYISSLNASLAKIRILGLPDQ